MSGETLKPHHFKARLIRALSGLSQEQMSERTGIPASVLAQLERGNGSLTEEELERMAGQARFESADADELLRLYQTQTRAWLRTSEGAGPLLQGFVGKLRRRSLQAVQRLLKLPAPQPVDPGRADEQIAQLLRLSHRSRLAVVRSAEDFRSSAMAARCRQEAERQAADPRRADAWTRLAAEIEGGL